MTSFQLTPAGLDALKTELEVLSTEKRKAAVERLSRARAMGDLSENSEYHAAKEDLAVVAGRIRELQELIKHAEVVTVSEDGNIVGLGRTVVVETPAGEVTYTIVGEFEADPMSGKLSSTSPIGRALIGHHVGDSVKITIPAGTTTYKVVSIS